MCFSLFMVVQRTLNTAIDDIEELRAARIREKMGDLDQAISFAYIAKNYFGKSYSWLAQRLNDLPALRLEVWEFFLYLCVRFFLHSLET